MSRSPLRRFLREARLRFLRLHLVRELRQDPCSATSPQTLTVAAVAALPDGSRAYVGAYYEDTVNNTNYICPQVTVIDVASNTIKSSTAVPGFPASMPSAPPPAFA